MKTEFFYVSPLGLLMTGGIGMFHDQALLAGEPSRAAACLFIAAVLSVALRSDLRVPAESGRYERARFGLWRHAGDIVPGRGIERGDRAQRLH